MFHFEKIRAEINDLQETVDDLEEELLLVNTSAQADAETAEAETVDDHNNTTNIATLPPVFSKRDDTKGYDAKVLSWSRANSILRAEFQNRKLLQESKMRGLTATMLKFDFQHEMAKKTRVWSGPGRSCRPCCCILTTLNEPGMCVFWKALKTPESFKEVRDDSIKLQEHLQHNAEDRTKCPVLAAWIDNCCTVSNVEGQTKRIWKNCSVHLDIFHWMKRFDKMLVSTATKEAALFRSMLRRAVFVVGVEECERAKSTVEPRVQAKKGRQATTKEILQEARTTVPPPDILRQRVMTVLDHALQVDSDTERRRPQGEEASGLPRFFEPMNGDHRHSIERQLHHIDNGCSSDPTNVDIHTTNPVTGVHCVTRGTSHNEVFNKCTNALLGNSIGTEWTDRSLWGFFEVMNDTRRIHRLGETDCGTSRAEVLALLNSTASGAGFANGELPFPSLAMPCLLPNRCKEAIGLNWHCPECDNASNPTQTSNLQAFDAGTEEHLMQIDFDAVEEDEDSNAEEPENDEEEDSTEPIALNENQDSEEDINLQLEVDAEVEHLLVLDQRSPETSSQTFNRLTNKEPWIPFRPVNSTIPKTQLDIAECQLFQQMKKDFKRHASPGQPLGYKDFELAWNSEVAERHRKSVDSDCNNPHIAIINRKSHCNNIMTTSLKASALDALSTFGSLLLMR